MKYHQKKKSKRAKEQKIIDLATESYIHDQYPQCKGFELETIRHTMQEHWNTFESLEKATFDALRALKYDLENKAPIEILLEDRNRLMLLLGECNYMARACEQLENGHRKQKSRKKPVKKTAKKAKPKATRSKK